MHLTQISLTRQKYDALLNGKIIAESGSLLEINAELQQFLCLKDQRYFVSFLHLLGGKIYFDYASIKQMLFIDQIDRFWLIKNIEE